MRRWSDHRLLRWLRVSVHPLMRVEEARGLEEVAPGRWAGRGEASSLTIRRGLPGPGWHMVEAVVESDHLERELRLQVDYGAGFIEEEAFLVAARPGHQVKRLVHFERRPQGLRLVLPAQAGPLTIQYFRLVRVAGSFARKRLVRRLWGIHPAWRDVAPAEVGAQLKALARAAGVGLPRLAMQYYGETFGRIAHGADYAEWIARQPQSSRQQLAGRLRLLEEVGLGADGEPLFSLLLRVKGAEIRGLEACVESVLTQAYGGWELCIVPDAAANPAVAAVLAAYERRDARVRVDFQSVVGGAAAGNAALALASGRYVAVLEQDDCLHSEALLSMAEAVAANPQWALLYSDQDCIADDGERSAPRFKPDWNPDLALSQNYVGGLALFRRDRVQAIGGFREALEGSQAHDLLLRFTQGLDPAAIHHVPRVLYHAHADSRTQPAASGDAVVRAGVQAVQEAAQVEAPAAEVEPGLEPAIYHVRWPLPEPVPKVSLIVPTRDRVAILRPCVEALLERTDYPDYELIIVDNRSTCPETLAYLAEKVEDTRVRVLEWPHAFNYSAINNFAAEHARGSVLGLINNDIEPINRDWLDEMVRQASRPAIGCVGAKLYYPDDRIQHGGVILGLGGLAGHGHRYFARDDPGYMGRLKLVQNLSAVTAACLLVQRSIFEAVGGLDAEHLAVAFNDVDLCLRIQDAGYRNLWTPYAEAFHHESVSRGKDDTPAKRRRFEAESTYLRQRWGPILDNDPAYNPNLTRAYEDFSLR